MTLPIFIDRKKDESFADYRRRIREAVHTTLSKHPYADVKSVTFVSSHDELSCLVIFSGMPDPLFAFEEFGPEHTKHIVENTTNHKPKKKR